MKNNTFVINAFFLRISTPCDLSACITSMTSRTEKAIRDETLYQVFSPKFLWQVVRTRDCRSGTAVPSLIQTSFFLNTNLPIDAICAHSPASECLTRAGLRLNSCKKVDPILGGAPRPRQTHTEDEEEEAQ